MKALKRYITPAEWIATGLVILACLTLAASEASANPIPRGQYLTIYAGGETTTRGSAYGAERTDARLYYDGSYHTWYGCRRSTWDVHYWICSYTGNVPVGHYAFVELAYWNQYGWSYGNSPWVYSSCCENHTGVSGVLG